jgi:hypothetical protein
MSATEPRENTSEGDEQPLSPAAERVLAAIRTFPEFRPSKPYPDKGWGSASWTGPSTVSTEVMRGNQAVYSETLTSDWFLVDGKARPRLGVPYASRPATAKTGQIERLFASVLTSKGSIDLGDPRLPKGRCALHPLAGGSKVPAYRDSGRICKVCSDWCSRNKFTHADRVVYLRSKAASSALHGKQLPKWADLHEEPEQEAQTSDPDWAGPSWLLKIRTRRLDWHELTKRRTQRTKKVRHRHGPGSTSYTTALLPDELQAVEKAAEKDLEDRVARAEADRDGKTAYLAQPGHVVREVKAKHGTLRFVKRKVTRG